MLEHLPGGALILEGCSLVFAALGLDVGGQLVGLAQETAGALMLCSVALVVHPTSLPCFLCTLGV